jgi:hypothetical protein
VDCFRSHLRLGLTFPGSAGQHDAILEQPRIHAYH